MVEENYKPEAKCRFQRLCSIYNAGLLREEFETQMCGRGQKPVNGYVPMVPEHSNIQPVKDFEIWPGGECPAFKGYIYQGFIGDLEDLVDDVARELRGESPKL